MLKRKNKELRPNETKWINRGGNFYMANGKCIKPGQTFTATEDEVPEAFRDVLIPLEPIKPAEPIEAVKSEYVLQKIESGRYNGKFNVVDPNGKIVNEKPLTEDQAKEIIDTLG